MTGAYRVVVVDDSSFMRKIISDILNSSDYLEVVGTAVNGVDALEKVKALKPDAVTMDIEMPEMDGLTALDRIMHECPVPVIMLSNRTRFGAEATVKALDLGALDFVAKPSGNISLDIDKVQDELILKVKVAAQADIKLIQKMASSKVPNLEESVEVNKPLCYNHPPGKIIAIGSSTGGPRALQTVLSKMPADIPAAIVVVQHMPAGFTKSLAQRLNSISQIGITEACEGDELMPGKALIAPGNRHMKIKRVGDRFYISLSDEPPVGGLKPCIDKMMESLADCGVPLVGVLLTGMGQDGVVGFKRLQEVNAYTIAEDESTCVVFGMPRAAIENKCVDSVVPIHQIFEEILEHI